MHDAGDHFDDDLAPCFLYMNGVGLNGIEIEDLIQNVHDHDHGFRGRDGYESEDVHGQIPENQDDHDLKTEAGAAGEAGAAKSLSAVAGFAQTGTAACGALHHILVQVDREVSSEEGQVSHDHQDLEQVGRQGLQ